MDEEINIAPNIIDDGMPENPRPQSFRRAPHRLYFNIHQADRDWNELAHFCNDMDLIHACATDATVEFDAP